jgi:hypothetical protein
VDPTEPSEHVLEEARNEVKETVHNAQISGKRLRWLPLVAAGLLVGVLFFGVLFYRAVTTERSDTALCMKIDRFIVAAEQGIRMSPVLSPAEKKVRIKFYENFRNDPPVCRTN